MGPKLLCHNPKNKIVMFWDIDLVEQLSCLLISTLQRHDLETNADCSLLNKSVSIKTSRHRFFIQVSIMHTIWLRKYYSPIICFEIIQFNPQRSDCARISLLSTNRGERNDQQHRGVVWFRYRSIYMSQRSTKFVDIRGIWSVFYFGNATIVCFGRWVPAMTYVLSNVAIFDRRIVIAWTIIV